MGRECEDRVPKGYIPVLVGPSGEEMEKFVIRTKFLSHRYFEELLEMAAEEFGYEQEGILKIPCNVEYFRRVIDMIMESD